LAKDPDDVLSEEGAARLGEPSRHVVTVHKEVLMYANGHKTTLFKNGTRKDEYPEGRKTVVVFHNGDIKRAHADGTVIYQFAKTNATNVTLPNHVEIYVFENGQKERHYPHGKKEIYFPDGTYRVVHPDGSDATTYADGQVERRASPATHRGVQL